MPGPGRPFQPGKSGNPQGRPPKARALTEILNRAGSRTVEVDGQKISGKRLVARLLWDVALTGEVVLPNGRVLKVGGQGWLDVVKFLYAQIDGPPRQDVDLTSGGRTLNLALLLDDTDGTT